MRKLDVHAYKFNPHSNRKCDRFVAQTACDFPNVVFRIIAVFFSSKNLIVPQSRLLCSARGLYYSANAAMSNKLFEKSNEYLRWNLLYAIIEEIPT